MADNYLERHREDYEKRKQAWLRKKRHLPQVSQKINKPEDESL
ncbi:MAG: dehydrogenase [Prevotella sp.]|nr:dehydrogenase [Prevotella sp.]MDD7606855.1 dehydrogenase [Prevotellaceae bacterium]MDY3247261.1 dehydrogenase [Prevotella sp.]